MRYEYKVVPAPRRGQRAKGVKGSEARFAHAMQSLMNELAAEGWEYLRADTLPSEERQGLRGRSTSWQNMLIFRRPLGARAGQEQADAPSGAVIRPVPSMRRIEPVPSESQAPAGKGPEAEKAPGAADPGAGQGNAGRMPPLTRAGKAGSPDSPAEPVSDPPASVPDSAEPPKPEA